MKKYEKTLKIAGLSLCLMLLVSLTVQAKTNLSLTPKSKSTALTYSLAGTLAPIAMSIPILSNGDGAGLAVGSFGLFLGPGMGHLYADNPGRFVTGMFIRGAACAFAIYSISQVEIDFWGNENHDNSGPFVGFLLGSSVLLASTIYDIATTGESVDRHNKQHALSQLNLQPRYWPNHQTTGFSLAYRF